MFSKNKTLKETKTHKKGGKKEELSNFVKKTIDTLGTGSMKAAVALPDGEDLKEWLSVNTVDFFNEISQLYGAIEQYCTDESCPKMTAGDTRTYLWADGVRVKKPIECTAPQYVQYLMTWVEANINDENVFPVEYGNEFPSDFINIVKTIFKRFFRVYAHIYHTHYKIIASGGADAHLNTCFKHFLYFVEEFNLVKESEMAPLADLIAKFKKREKEREEQEQKDEKS